MEKINRNFQLWKYEPSHSQLVLMSQKSLGQPNRLIYIFKGVKRVSISTYFHCMTIKEQIIKEGRKFTMEGDNGRNIIYAFDLIQETDNKDYDAPIETLQWTNMNSR